MRDEMLVDGEPAADLKYKGPNGENEGSCGGKRGDRVEVKSGGLPVAEVQKKKRGQSERREEARGWAREEIMREKSRADGKPK
ncbi:hypothetical protein EYF80_002127 [Liparis tanakae]|uniref:Uncharacterized protein n=1 Tax=Liparis tanakae TaxID=230148 RepID=A0A4Z2JC93_9TELE|nr:hypothetical protein EYF80_002127 [Liparis tanakae]